MESNDPSVTRLIVKWQQGDADATDSLATQAYAELRAIAAGRLAKGGPVALQPTELVNEAWIRLSANRSPFNSSAHFYAVAALQMRHLLIDLARMQASRKRQGEATTLTVSIESSTPQPEDLTMIAEAFEQLAQLDERKAQAFALVELAGFSIPECAGLLDVSVATLQRDLRFARSWLASRMAC